MAFSKAIVTEITPHLPYHVDCGTAHSFGNRFYTKQMGRCFLDKYKVEMIIKEKFPFLNPDNEGSKEEFSSKLQMLRSTVELVGFIKTCLSDPKDSDQLDDLVFRYGIEVDTDAIYPILPDILEENDKLQNVIDFTDMIYLPLKYGVNIPKFDVLLVDEAQDLSPMQLELATRACKRIITVGDRYQAIFGFAGADCDSIDKIIAKFNSTQLPLNTTYRCGKKIVELAQQIVPEIVAHENNPEGEVIFTNDNEVEWERFKDGDMMIARRNAVLVKPAMKMIRMGKKAVIKGRDIGKTLLQSANSVKGDTIEEFVRGVDVLRENKMKVLMNRKRPSQTQIEMLNDQCDALLMFAESAGTVVDVKNAIQNIFSDEQQGITLSSMHRSKGLEADRVTILDASRMSIPTVTPEQAQQEKNLEYVAKTRAKTELMLVV